MTPAITLINHVRTAGIEATGKSSHLLYEAADLIESQEKRIQFLEHLTGLSTEGVYRYLDKTRTEISEQLTEARKRIAELEAELERENRVNFENKMDDTDEIHHIEN